MIRRLRTAGGPMSVLLLTNSVAMGGMEEHVRLLAAHLDREAFVVSGVAPDDPAVAGFAAALRSQVDVFACITADRRRGLRRAGVESLRLARFVRRQRIDVAHLHSTTYGGLWVAVTMCWLGGARRVYVTEHLAPYDGAPRAHRVERAAFNRVVSGLVCVSEKNRAARAACLSMPRRTTVVTNGIDVSRMDEVSTSAIAEVRASYELDGRVVVGTAIRLEPGKGMVDLVTAFARVVATHPQARLLIVGDGSLRAELEQLAGELGIGDTVVFAGFQADPRPYLGAMDVFVLPVPAGSASIGLLEAMATGLPAVISFGGTGEAVVPGVSGWWAEPNDPESLAERIGDLVGDDEARAKMGEAARERIERDFSAEGVADKLGALYQGSSAG